MLACQSREPIGLLQHFSLSFDWPEREWPSVRLIIMMVFCWLAATVVSVYGRLNGILGDRRELVQREQRTSRTMDGQNWLASNSYSRE